MPANNHELIAMTESVIKEVCIEFRGEGAFNFQTEADIRGAMLGRLRANGNLRIHTTRGIYDLAHAEMPGYGTSWTGTPRHDLVIWNPALVIEARGHWGDIPGKWSDILQNGLNLVCIELEKFAGLPWNIRQHEIYSDEGPKIVEQKLRDHSDLRKLIQCKCTSAYFLLFWDENVGEKDDLDLCYKAIERGLKLISAENPKIKTACVTKDGRSCFAEFT